MQLAGGPKLEGRVTRQHTGCDSSLCSSPGSVPAPIAGLLPKKEVVVVTKVEHCVVAHVHLALEVGYGCEHPPHSAIVVAVYEQQWWCWQVPLIAVVDPVDHGFKKKGNLILPLHFYSIYGGVVSTEIIWDNYLHLVSDTAIHPPDICASFHSVILHPPCPRLSGAALRRVGHCLLHRHLGSLHSIQYTVLTMSQVGMLLLWVHSYIV